ncbi:MAG: lipocalin family protein [Chthoniobacterales bacterium]
MNTIILRTALTLAAVIFLTTTAMAFSNEPIKSIDLKRFDGKWYSLTSIPTMLDKDWLETIEYYTLKDDDTYDVRTTYRKEGEEKTEEITSRLFPGDETEVGEMKAQFVWPFKVGYRVIELADDYSYVVIGHPKEKYLFIMSRKPTMPQDQMDAIVARCKELGYPTEKLKSQEHGATPDPAA